MASEKPASRIWYMANAEFDEGRWELRVAGERRAVEAKPLALLHALLCHAGEAVTKAELLDAVWPGVMVVEGSLTTAVSKLRAGLGEEGRTIVEAVHGIGYRLGVPCTVRITSDRERFATSLRAGNAVPNRPQWVLERQIGGASASDVWLALHEKTREQRVFKFADTASRLLALRRETDLARALTRALGERPDFLRVLEWNFESRPYFIETAYGGPDLAAWAAERGGLANVPLAARLDIAARVARIAGAAHGAGVLHRDIKPSNILVDGTGQDMIIRLVDFGSGRLTDAALLSSLSISGLALTADPMATGDGAGLTLRYMAPELVHGGLPSIAADVYALGILLYELVLGDLGRPLAAGWEADITDPLLRQDIAAAAAGDPSRRLASASLLADRLDNLAARRAELRRQEEAAAAARDMAARVERMRARRPWLATASFVMLIGAAAVGIAEIRAERRGSEAARQAAIAQAVNHFLTDDLLARGDPERAGKADETLMEAAGRAEGDVDMRFGAAPLIAGQIHLALADAFDRRSAYPIARNAYHLAIADFTRAQGADSPDAVVATLRLATMEAFTEEAGAAARAQSLLAHTQASLSALPNRRNEAQVWRLTCEGGVALSSGHADRALPLFTQAAELADALPAAFDESRRLWFRENEARSLVRLGRWSQAETLLQSLLPRQIALHGARDANTLLIELTMAQALMARGESAQAEADFDRLYPLFISVYGPTHRLTERLLGARAQALGQLERYDEAIRDDQVLYQLAVSGHGEHSWPAIAALSDVAESQCRAGHGEAGLATARAAAAAAQASFGGGSVQAMAMTGEVAFCLIIDDHASDAAPLIDSIDPKALSQLGAGPDFPAQLDVMRAAIALREHDPARARALLKAPSRIFARPDADPYVQRWTVRLAELANR